MKYEELGEKVDDVEEEWKKYKDAFVENAEELLWKITVYGWKSKKKIKNGGQPKSRQQQYVKRRKPGRLLKRSRSMEISLTEGC